jgi:hypothetical protein
MNSEWWRMNDDSRMNSFLVLLSTTTPHARLTCPPVRQSQSQSQSYFTTGGLPPISSSWWQAPWVSRPGFFFICGHSHYVTSSLTRGFIIAAGPCQLNHSQVRVPWDSWWHFTVSDSRLPQHGRLDPRIYIPQEQGGSVIPQALGSLIVASFDSQCYGGGIRPLLYTVLSCAFLCVLLL